MSLASKFFETLKRRGYKNTETFETLSNIPTLKFDASRVTNAVKADIRKNILLLEIDSRCVDRVYEAAIRSISAGRDLSVLQDTLMQLNVSGMTKQRAGEIALFLNNRATAFMIARAKRQSA